jgi:hypothetical protein
VVVVVLVAWVPPRGVGPSAPSGLQGGWCRAASPTAREDHSDATARTSGSTCRTSGRSFR